MNQTREFISEHVAGIFTCMCIAITLTLPTFMNVGNVHKYYEAFTILYIIVCVFMYDKEIGNLWKKLWGRE